GGRGCCGRVGGGAGDELVDGDAAEFAVCAPFVVGGEGQVEFEGGEQFEDLAAVVAVDADEHLVEQDQPGGLGHGLVVGGDGGEQGQVQGDCLLAAGECAVQFLGEQLPVRTSAPVHFDDELVPGGVVEDLGELLLPACCDVGGPGLLDAVAEEPVQGGPVGFGEMHRVLEEQVAGGFGAGGEVLGYLPDEADRHLGGG